MSEITMNEDQNIKKGFKQGLLAGIAITAMIAAGVVLCVFLIHTFFSPQHAALTFDEATYRKLDELHGVIDKYYYKDADEDALADGMYNGLIAGLDDEYAEYFSPEEAKKYSESLTGNYDGIGAGMTQDSETGEIIVTFIYDGSPAKAAGLRKEDIVLSVDGEDITGETLDKVVAKIRGLKGTNVTLVVDRDGEEKTLEIERDTIQIPSISHRMLDDNIGYILILDFSNGTLSEFKTALKDLQAQGAEGIIYDLRGNPGGYMEVAAAMLDEVLPAGTVVYTIDKSGKRTEYTSDDEKQVDLPSAILINEGTASAAEIFTGAMKDFDAATLIGTTTYGKGCVQSVVTLSDRSIVKVTSRDYFTPSGENITGKGIEPDIELEYEFLGDEEAFAEKDEDELTNEDYLNDNQIRKAYEILTK